MEDCNCAQKPIEALMKSVMDNIKNMIDVNTVVGEPFCTAEQITIIPVSKVSFGIVTGGGEYTSEKCFAGGNGAGVTISPVGFLVAGEGDVRMIPCDPPSATIAENVIEMVREGAEYWFNRPPQD